MNNKARLIVTDSQFNVFPILCRELDGKACGLEGKNLIFCDEKISLMAERSICAAKGGSFNTDVYSFGNYLRIKKNTENVLSKEGSAMAIKRILTQANLQCFSPSKTCLAPSLFELIIQLKSAKVTPQEIMKASENTDGVLKNKLRDIYEVFTGYENFLKENGFEDQSSALSYLPEIIENDTSVKSADVYLVGFSSWTNQARGVVSALLKNAKSVTAILTDGKNKNLFVGETVCAFKTLCAERKIVCEEFEVFGEYSVEGKILSENIFNPYAFAKEKTITDNVLCFSPKTVRSEVETVAETIKALVIDRGYRFKDFSVAVSDVNEYRDDLSYVFNLLGIPFFLDEKKKPERHPLITLIISYIDVFRKNMERTALGSFYKNPLFCDDKTLIDGFENYVIKYNVNFSGFKKEFVFERENENTLSYENLRKEICSCFTRFDIKELLNRLDVKNKLVYFSSVLNGLGEYEERAVNEQIYDATIKILDEMQKLLGNTELSFNEIKSVFLSGVMAMELSIIPQYNDAVFVGGYKEVALASPKILFAVGLTDKVPFYKNDVALLSDGEINRLSKINVLVEPKIRVVNQRTCESVGLAVSAFSEKLFLSYPAVGNDGKKNAKSEVVLYADGLFTLKKYAYTNGYLTERQGLINFAKEYGKYRSGELNDYSFARAFMEVKRDGGELYSVLKNGDRKTEERINSVGSLIKSVTSPTTLEDYYKCPYYAFASHVLKLKEREDGFINGLSVGNFIHAVLDVFVNVYKDVTENNFERLFNEIVNKVLEREEFAKYNASPDTRVLLDGVIREAEKHCKKIYYDISNSAFKPCATEKKFLTPITDAVTLTGKVDRIDVFGDYYMIADYKTGKTDSGAKGLFTGNKLQLYLYAKGVQTAAELNGKTLAGAYYLPLNDDYKSSKTVKKSEYDGKILDAADIVNPGVDDSNVVSGNVLNAYVDYALKISQKAAEQMSEGVITVSPYQGACEYCNYKGLCGKSDGECRTVEKVDDKVIEEAVREENDVRAKS